MRPDYIFFAVLVGVFVLVAWLFYQIVFSKGNQEKIPEWEKGPDVGKAAAYTAATVFTFTVMPYVYIFLVLVVVGALGFIFDF